MYKILCVLSLALLVNQLYAVDSDKCQEKPKDKHCLIEYAARDRWPHEQRWVFDWYTKTCFLIRWSTNCHAPAADTNNFASSDDCFSGCGGWA